MITIPQLTAQALGAHLSKEIEGRFGSSHDGLTDLLPFAARLTLECIGNSDALYHNIEHTMLVTLVGHDILVGRALQRNTTATDYANFILGCLAHDIGYVRGIVQGDEDAALGGFEAVADVGKGAVHDGGHGVGEVGVLEFLFDPQVGDGGILIEHESPF